MSESRKGFAAGHEDFLDTEFGCLAGDPLHAREAKLPAWRFGRGAHATIVAMQVAVEIRVEPKTRADRAIGAGIRRSLSAADHPPHAASLDGRIDQGVAREAAPSLKVGAETPLAANYGQEIARATSTQRSDKLGQQAGCKRFNTGVELDVRFGLHTLLAHDRPSISTGLWLILGLNA